MSVEKLIDLLKLLPHPEGGYYRETYRSSDLIPETALPEFYSGVRNASTAIYFMLPKHQFSAFHRLKSDEIWHFYAGTQLSLYSIDSAGELTLFTLGGDIAAGEVPQAVISRGDWFAAEVTGPGEYSLLGCTVAPGFNFDDFEMAGREEMLRRYPRHRDILERLCIK